MLFAHMFFLVFIFSIFRPFPRSMLLSAVVLSGTGRRGLHGQRSACRHWSRDRSRDTWRRRHGAGGDQEAVHHAVSFRFIRWEIENRIVRDFSKIPQICLMNRSKETYPEQKSRHEFHCSIFESSTVDFEVINFLQWPTPSLTENSIVPNKLIKTKTLSKPLLL